MSPQGQLRFRLRGRIAGQIALDNQNGSISISAARSASCKNISAKTSFSPSRSVSRKRRLHRHRAHFFGRINTDLPITATGEVGGNPSRGKSVTRLHPVPNQLHGSIEIQSSQNEFGPRRSVSQCGVNRRVDSLRVGVLGRIEMAGTNPEPI